MKISRIVLAAVAASLFFFVSFDARAQRLIPGQMEAYLEGSPWMAVQGGAGLGVLDRTHRWDYFLSWYSLKNSVLFSADEEKDIPEMSFDMRYGDALAGVSYKALVAYNRSRSVVFWIGGGLQAGVRVRMPSEDYGKDFEDRINNLAFAYAVNPDISLELFPFKRLSVTLFAKPVFVFTAEKVSVHKQLHEKWFIPETGLRLSYCFFPKR